MNSHKPLRGRRTKPRLNAWQRLSDVVIHTKDKISTIIYLLTFHKKLQKRCLVLNEKEQKICHTLWEECEPICRSICLNKFQSCPSEVNDVVSELFLALCQKMDEDGLPKKPKNWIYGTLNNLINAKFKNLYKDREYCVSMDNDNFTIPLVEPDYIGKRINELSNKKLIKELQSVLSKDECQLIYYIYFENLKMKQIAQIYHTTEDAIKQKHYRICRKLRKNSKKFKFFL